jgi:hypothetical protein
VYVNFSHSGYDNMMKITLSLSLLPSASPLFQYCYHYYFYQHCYFTTSKNWKKKYPFPEFFFNILNTNMAYLVKNFVNSLTLIIFTQINLIINNKTFEHFASKLWFSLWLCQIWLKKGSYPDDFPYFLHNLIFLHTSQLLIRLPLIKPSW